MGSSVPASVEEQLAVLCRGVVDLYVKEELAERLSTGKPLRVKAGFDPTRPDLHIGHTVVMSKMRQFQDFGHEVVFIIGDFTARLGDPTGKNEARPRLSEDEVKEAAKTYAEQAFKVLDREQTTIRYNSEWLHALSPSDVVELGAKYTVARMLERDDFAKRYAAQRPIHVHEFMYPLFQAYDSVALECDIELGGTDQLFNLMLGRDIMPRYGKRPQLVMTTPLLEGTDAKLVDGKVVGPKMSKSNDNYVGIDEPPATMLQKLMLVDDTMLWRYAELLSSRSTDDIAAWKRRVESGEQSIIDAKEAFAQEIITRFHDETAATDALARRRRIQRGDAPEDVREVVVKAEGGEVGLAKALKLAALTKSTGEGFRLIKQGGVYLDGDRVTDEKVMLRVGDRPLVRLGSKNRRFAYLRIQ
ncbi:MAG: tyrosine--tRNA ligase [Myxococcota bacterium]